MSKRSLLRSFAFWAALLLSLPALAEVDEPGLLFYLSADHGLVADTSQGDPNPNFADRIAIRKDEERGYYIEASGEQVLSWMAPGNIQAQRGTLSFYWRARDPAGATPFPVFRVGYADHTSWDMVWLRIDWNGKGYDAFVTDDNLARVRVSYALPSVPSPDRWQLLTFTWDEAVGIDLYVDGKRVASKNQVAALDAGLDQFGPHSRIISPHQVQSQYQFIRGGDVDDIRIYDHALTAGEIADLAAGNMPVSAAPQRDLKAKPWQSEWWYRYGWNRAGDPPPYLSDAQTVIRKVEFTAAYDLKQRMMAGTDGIAETTWPGVYNRSTLPGRHDYFVLPDWNVYVEGGKAVTFEAPDEPWNRVEFQGAAYGVLSHIDASGAAKPIARRPKGELRTWNQFAPVQGGKLRFENVVQETPIQEVAAYNVHAGAEPDEQTLEYQVEAKAEPTEYPSVDELRNFIRGRYPADEREIAIALPDGAPSKTRALNYAPRMPLVHIVIPADFRRSRWGEPVGHYAYGWQGMNAGLDGIAIDLPALQVEPTHGAFFPLNIRVKDPLWPARDMLDINVAVKPGEARTVFLDLRDRILPPGASLYLVVAGAAGDFDAAKLDGMHVRLKFKPRAAAAAEHIADRFAQASDNLAFLVEEHDVSRRLARYERLDRDLSDLLRIDPENRHGREMWLELNPEQEGLPVNVPKAPAGVPAWAFLQVEDLKRVHRFIEWWIDHRQVDYGDFGGGISDDDDLTQQWPPLALMGVIPDKVTKSLDALMEAAYRNGMLSPGLGVIQTDELHSYEEALNLKSEEMYLDYGNPKVVERLMETAREYPKIIQKGSDGHTHVVSSNFSATVVSRELPWSWSHPYSYLILHPGIVLADFNGDPAMRDMILALADGHMAHGRQNADGSWEFPEGVNATTGEARGTLTSKSRGNIAIVQLFWAAYRWTGDAKYLRPLESEIARGPLGPTLEFLNNDVIDLLGKRDSWGSKLKADADKGSRDAFTLYQAWRTSGDTSYLEKIYSDEIATAEQRMWMVTEAHWWSDRVELFSDILQRSRLGGLALRRNQMYPGHVVSWRFDTPTAAEDVGILVADSTPQHFKITAFNLTGKPLHAVMTGWDVTAGRWKVSRAVAGTADPEQHIDFERTGSVDMTFAPMQPTTWEFTLETLGSKVSERPDLAIGSDDVKADSRGLRVAVHSLGSKPAAQARLVLEDVDGRELAYSVVPALSAPKAFQPVVTHVVLKSTAWKPGMRVRIVGDPAVPEVTLLNNVVVAH